MVVVDVEFLGVAEVSAQLAGVGGGEGNNVSHLDGIHHLKHQHGGNTLVSTYTMSTSYMYIGQRQRRR